jgi:ABC-type Fe3+-hydroxamate transport system substrate-binding protein
MAPVTVTDDLGKKITLRDAPARVVSLVPSDTYSIVRLGAAAQEENARPDIERLEASGVRVLVSFPRTVAAGINHLARLARILGLDHGAEPARSVVAAAYRAQKEAEARVVARPVATFLPIWMSPLMTANDQTFLADVLRLAGASNVFGDRDRRYPLAADLGRAAGLRPDQIEGRDTRYPRITLDEVALRAPELILLPDEPHPFTDADAAVFRGLDTPASRAGQVVFCDGKDLMWYGARSVEGIERLRALVDAARVSSSSSP